MRARRQLRSSPTWADSLRASMRQRQSIRVRVDGRFGQPGLLRGSASVGHRFASPLSSCAGSLELFDLRHFFRPLWWILDGISKSLTRRRFGENRYTRYPPNMEAVTSFGIV